MGKVEAGPFCGWPGYRFPLNDTMDQSSAGSRNELPPFVDATISIVAREKKVWF